MDVKAKLSNDDNFPSLKDKIGTSGSTCSWLLIDNIYRLHAHEKRRMIVS